MPKAFLSDWSVRYRDQDLVTLPIAVHDCRDTNYHAMTLALHKKIVDAAAAKGALPADDPNNLVWHNWVKQSVQDLTFGASVYYAADNDEFVSRTIGRVIDRLFRKYPTVTFDVSHLEHEFNDKSYDGIRLVGDVSVIPAWYWTTIILRYGNERSKWYDVNKLILDMEGERRKDQTYAAWERLRAGDELPAWQMLALRYGPVSSWDERALIGVRDGLLAALDLNAPQFRLEL